MIKDAEITCYLKKRFRMRKIRKIIGMTQAQLSEKSGICQKDISIMENGLRDYKMGTYFKYIKGLRK